MSFERLGALASVIASGLSPSIVMIKAYLEFSCVRALGENKVKVKKIRNNINKDFRTTI